MTKEPKTETQTKKILSLNTPILPRKYHDTQHTTFSIMTFSITTLRIKTFSITINETMKRDTQQNDTQQNDTQHNDTRCRVLLC